MAHDFYDYVLKASNSVSVSDSGRIQHEMHMADDMLRDHFAGLAMQSYADLGIPYDHVAMCAYMQADAMLEARKHK